MREHLAEQVYELGPYLDIRFAGQIAVSCQLLQSRPEPAHLLCQAIGHPHGRLQPLLHGSHAPGSGEQPWGECWVALPPW